LKILLTRAVLHGHRRSTTRRSRRRWPLPAIRGDRTIAELASGGAAAEGVASEAQIDLLYRQIGQLKVENDFLAPKLGK
jgi:hypothetical protein